MVNCVKMIKSDGFEWSNKVDRRLYVLALHLEALRFDL